VRCHMPPLTEGKTRGGMSSKNQNESNVRPIAPPPMVPQCNCDKDSNGTFRWPVHSQQQQLLPARAIKIIDYRKTHNCSMFEAQDAIKKTELLNQVERCTNLDEIKTVLTALINET